MRCLEYADQCPYLQQTLQKLIIWMGHEWWEGGPLWNPPLWSWVLIESRGTYMKTMIYGFILGSLHG